MFQIFLTHPQISPVFPNNHKYYTNSNSEVANPDIPILHESQSFTLVQ